MASSLTRCGWGEGMQGYVRPEFSLDSEPPQLVIKDGRHPVRYKKQQPGMHVFNIIHDSEYQHWNSVIKCGRAKEYWRIYRHDIKLSAIHIYVHVYVYVHSDSS